VTLENFAVGYCQTSGNAEADKKLIPELVKSLKKQSAAGLPKFTVTSEGERKLGEYVGTEIRFTSELSIPEKKSTVQIYGCWLILPNPHGGTNGVCICYLGTNQAPELKEGKDLGVKGDLPVILKSFRFGKK
jgi:hypothetical protein